MLRTSRSGLLPISSIMAKRSLPALGHKAPCHVAAKHLVFAVPKEMLIPIPYGHIIGFGPGKGCPGPSIICLIRGWVDDKVRLSLR